MYLYVFNAAFMAIFLASLRTNVALVIVFFGVIMGAWLIGSMYTELAAGATDKAEKLSKVRRLHLTPSAELSLTPLLAGGWRLPLHLGLLRILPRRRPNL